MATDLRRVGDIPADAASSHDPVVRRAQARALARILDDDAKPLLRALDDDDDEVLAWAAYGLGESCKGHPERVSAIAARLGSLVDGPPLRSTSVLLRSVGRCGTETAESALRPWLLVGTNQGEGAALALGEVSARRGQLSLETAAALIDAAADATPMPVALYPFSRSDVALEPAQVTRLKAAARAALLRKGPFRLFAVRVLGRLSDSGSLREVAALLLSGDALSAERIEAAHSLARMKAAGQSALAEALASLAGVRVELLEGARPNLLLTVIESLSMEGAALAEGPLWALARLDARADAMRPGLLRRASMLRCAAARKLARRALDSDVLRRCDLGDGEIGERARLDALAQEDGALSTARRAALVELAQSVHPQVREAALDVVARHAEMTDSARSLLAEALRAGEAGVVAKAAKVVAEHADMVFAGPPAGALDGAVAAALRVALGHAWARDLIETRAALVEAVLATKLPEGGAFVDAACRDENATLRTRVAKALASAALPSGRCASPDHRSGPAAEIGHELTSPVRIELETDAGPLALALDPVRAPVAVTRLVALARSGFYTATSFHRVVPGYLAQFGDPGGDGYGGSGEPLRCETSPMPFERGDIGVVISGRDTGSSQLFVTLARTPSLDGETTWVGRAEGNWDAVVEGDSIRAVRVVSP